MASRSAESPDWLEHYLRVPAWVLYVEMPSERILWVNDRLADDLTEPRAWFVGRDIGEIWTDGTKRKPGHRALAEGRSIDVIGDGKDLRGNWRWLDARITPIGGNRLLVVCQDISARIKLAGLRLILGQSFSTATRESFSEDFARQLLEGDSLEEICTRQRLDPVQVLAKLGKLVGEQDASSGLQLPPPAETAPVDLPLVPAWVSHYWDLPGPTLILDYPSLTVRWVNRVILERNQMRLEEVLGIDARAVWEDVPNWISVIDRTMREQGSLDVVHQGHSLRGKQQWMSVRTTPISKTQVLIFSEDVTADIRLQALRLLLGLNPERADGPAHVGEAFARLLLSGASIANIAAALELSGEEVRGQAALLLGRST